MSTASQTRSTAYTVMQRMFAVLAQTGVLGRLAA
jgi:hypothetical protein